MRIDHIAFRVANREAWAGVLKALGWKEQERFRIPLSDGSMADSIALVPQGTVDGWGSILTAESIEVADGRKQCEYHLPAEIFVTDQHEPGLIDNWVDETGGGIHHIAFEVEDVAAAMEEWKARGFEFTTDEPIICPEDDLEQVFTKPIKDGGGLIFEFIKRGSKGFCLDSIKRLMESTKDV